MAVWVRCWLAEEDDDGAGEISSPLPIRHGSMYSCKLELMVVCGVSARPAAQEEPLQVRVDQ
jgi:hypothetical protein